MLASATAALQTQPCLFPYASARGDYTIKYTINIRLQASSYPLLSRNFPSWLLSSDSSTEMSSAEDTAYLLNLRGADSTALSDVISNYFGGGDQEKEALGMFT